MEITWFSNMVVSNFPLTDLSTTHRLVNFAVFKNLVSRQEWNIMLNSCHYQQCQPLCRSSLCLCLCSSVMCIFKLFTCFLFLFACIFVWHKSMHVCVHVCMGEHVWRCAYITVHEHVEAWDQCWIASWLFLHFLCWGSLIPELTDPVGSCAGIRVQSWPLGIHLVLEFELWSSGLHSKHFTHPYLPNLEGSYVAYLFLAGLSGILMNYSTLLHWTCSYPSVITAFCIVWGIDLIPSHTGLRCHLCPHVCPSIILISHGC